MRRILDRLPKHPRRFGFAIFNVAMLTAIVAWGVFTSNASSSAEANGVLAVPSLLIGYAGMYVLGGIFVLGWVLWTGFVIYHGRRRRHHSRGG